MNEPSTWYETTLFYSIATLVGGALVQAFHAVLNRRASSVDRFHADLFARVQSLERDIVTERIRCDNKIDELRAYSDRQRNECVQHIERLQISNDELRSQLVVLQRVSHTGG